MVQRRAVGAVLGRGRSLAERLVAEQSTCTTSASNFVYDLVEE